MFDHDTPRKKSASSHDAAVPVDTPPLPHPFYAAGGGGLDGRNREVQRLVSLFKTTKWI